MNCNEYQKSLNELIDVELRDKESVSTFSHLSECKTCRTYLQALLHVRSALTTREMFHIPSQQLDERVLAIPLHAPVRVQRRPFANFWRAKFALPAPAVGTVLILLLASIATSILFISKHAFEATPREKLIYVVTLQPIEVQGTYTPVKHETQNY